MKNAEPIDLNISSLNVVEFVDQTHAAYIRGYGREPKFLIVGPVIKGFLSGELVRCGLISADQLDVTGKNLTSYMGMTIVTIPHECVGFGE